MTWHAHSPFTQQQRQCKDSFTPHASMYQPEAMGLVKNYDLIFPAYFCWDEYTAVSSGFLLFYFMFWFGLVYFSYVLSISLRYTGPNRYHVMVISLCTLGKELDFVWWLKTKGSTSHFLFPEALILVFYRVMALSGGCFDVLIHSPSIRLRENCKVWTLLQQIKYASTSKSLKVQKPLTSPFLLLFFLSSQSWSLSPERCYKALCLIKTHCPTNWEAGNSRRCFTNRNNSCSLSLNWGNKKVLENIHQMHIHVHHQRGLDLGAHKSNVECSNQELYRQQGNKESETQIHQN